MIYSIIKKRRKKNLNHLCMYCRTIRWKFEKKRSCNWMDLRETAFHWPPFGCPAWIRPQCTYSRRRSKVFVSDLLVLYSMTLYGMSLNFGCDRSCIRIHRRRSSDSQTRHPIGWTCQRPMAPLLPLIVRQGIFHWSDAEFLSSLHIHEFAKERERECIQFIEVFFL